MARLRLSISYTMHFIYHSHSRFKSYISWSKSSYFHLINVPTYQTTDLPRIGVNYSLFEKKVFDTHKLIAHPHLLVQVTSEQFLPALVTTSGSHWLNQL